MFCGTSHQVRTACLVSQTLADSVQLGQIRLVEPIPEVAHHSVLVSPGGPPEPFHATVCQSRGHTPAILPDPAATDQAHPLKPVDQAGEPGTGKQHRVGQLGHPQPPFGCVSKLNQHVVRRQRQPLFRDELSLKRSCDRGVPTQVGPPDR
jgi:hypothetical protein